MDKVVVHSMGYGMTRGRRRPVVPLGVQLPHQLLEPGLGRHPVRRRAGGRARQAQGQEDRPRLPQQPLRQGSQPDAGGPGEEVPVRADAAGRRSPGPGAEVHLAAGAPAQPGLDLHVRLGRDEPGGGEGSGRPSASRWTTSSATGGRATSPTWSRPATAPRATSATTFHAPGHQLQGARRHREERLRQGQGRRARRRRWARPLYNRGIVNAMLDGRGHPHGAWPSTATRRADRRAGALGLREPEPHRQAAGRARHEGLHAAAQGHLRGPRGQRPGADPAVGRQEVGRSSRTGSCRCATSCGPKLEAAAVEEGKKLGYTPRDCSKEK